MDLSHSNKACLSLYTTENLKKLLYDEAVFFLKLSMAIQVTASTR